MDHPLVRFAPAHFEERSFGTGRAPFEGRGDGPQRIQPEHSSSTCPVPAFAGPADLSLGFTIPPRCVRPFEQLVELALQHHVASVEMLTRSLRGR